MSRASRPAGGAPPHGPYDAPVPEGTARVSAETARTGAWSPSRAVPAAPTPSAEPSAVEPALVCVAPPAPARQNRSVGDRLDAFVSRLSTRNNFWHRVCSLIWLPYAFKSGIRMRRLDRETFAAVLPFRRFNRNWYNAMAGAALLANSEVAGGMYVFGVCGGDYTVVCKELGYKFLRPCFGPALYRITPREDIGALARSGLEFNVTLDLDIVQQIARRTDKERRVGKCVATFHVTPKTHQKKKGRKIRP